MNRLVKSALLVGAVGVGLFSVGAGAAHADIVPQIGASDVTLQLDGNYKWSYEGQLNPAQKVIKGDFFTIYDFSGFVPGTNLQPADWAFSWSNSGRDADRTAAAGQRSGRHRRQPRHPEPDLDLHRHAATSPGRPIWAPSRPSRCTGTRP